MPDDGEVSIAVSSVPGTTSSSQWALGNVCWMNKSKQTKYQVVCSSVRSCNRNLAFWDLDFSHRHCSPRPLTAPQRRFRPDGQTDRQAQQKMPSRPCQGLQLSPGTGHGHTRANLRRSAAGQNESTLSMTRLRRLLQTCKHVGHGGGEGGVGPPRW